MATTKPRTWQFCWWPFWNGENVTFWGSWNDLQLADQTVTLLNHLGRIFSVIQNSPWWEDLPNKNKKKRLESAVSWFGKKENHQSSSSPPRGLCLRYWSEELEVFFPRICPSSTLSAKHLASCETKAGYQMETPMINSKNDCSFMLTATVVGDSNNESSES